MSAVGSEVYERAKKVGISGGLTADEAQDEALEYAESDPEPYPPESVDSIDATALPAAAAYMHEQEWERDVVPEAIPDQDEFIRCLDYSTERCSISQFVEESDEKRNEYLIRTLYTLSEDLNSSTIDDSINSMLSEPGKDTAVPMAQYIDDISEIVGDQDIIQEIYNTIWDYEDARNIALAKVPAEEVPKPKDVQYEEVQGVELSEGTVVPRLRSMKGAGQCKLMDRGHMQSLVLDGDLDNYPPVSEIDDRTEETHARNTTLIRVGDEMIGAIKDVGQSSMVGLQNVKQEGKIPIEKGRSYRVSYNVIDQQESSQIVNGWRVLDLDRVEVRPMRRLGDNASTDESPAEFREMIDERMETLEL